jgi:hypothetical protein
MIDDRERKRAVEKPVDPKEEEDKQRREAIRAVLRRGYGGREPPGSEGKTD